MPRHHERRIVPYTDEQMYGLVADVARYPEFLPWCAAAKLGAREEIDGRTIQMAELTVAFAHIRETYTSQVTMDPSRGRIAAQHVQGPFQHLDTLWVFAPKGEGACMIECTVDFAFKSRSMQAVMAMVFGSAVSRMASAFEARARVLYGSKSRLPIQS
jgi:coenzyme Q-binding protein COQ10